MVKRPQRVGQRLGVPVATSQERPACLLPVARRASRVQFHIDSHARMMPVLTLLARGYGRSAMARDLVDDLAVCCGPTMSAVSAGRPWALWYVRRMRVMSAAFWLPSSDAFSAVACRGSGCSTAWLTVTPLAAVRFTTPAPACGSPSGEDDGCAGGEVVRLPTRRQPHRPAVRYARPVAGRDDEVAEASDSWLSVAEADDGGSAHGASR